MKKQFHVKTIIVKITNNLQFKRQMGENNHKLLELYRTIISKYVPDNAVDHVIKFVIKNNIIVKIKKERFSKFGDFKPLDKTKSMITINHNLSKDHFLVTLLHEFAHFNVWKNGQYRSNPHGELWKKEFKDLIDFYIEEKCFDLDFEKILRDMFRVIDGKIRYRKSILLNHYARKKTNVILVENLPENCKFMLKNGRVFQLINKRKSRYLCEDLTNGRKYLVSGLAETMEVN
jgi:SprT protein